MSIFQPITPLFSRSHKVELSVSVPDNRMRKRFGLHIDHRTQRGPTMRRIITLPLIIMVLVLPASRADAQTIDDGMRLTKQGVNIQKKAQTHAELKKAVKKYEQALGIFEKVGFKEGIGFTANRLGNVVSDWGQYAKAVSYFEKALAIDRAVKNLRGEGLNLNNLGVVYKDWGKYDKAMKCYEKALAISRAVKNRSDEGKTLNNMGVVYCDWGQCDKAVEYYEKSLAIRSELKDRRGEGQTLNNLGNVYKGRGQYAKATRYYEKALAISRTLKDRRGEGNTLANLGNIFSDWGQHAKAVSYYEKALLIKSSLNDRPGEGGILNSLGTVYADWGHYAKAMKYYEKALAISRALKDRVGEGNTLINLGNVYAKWGQYEKAVSYYKKALLIKGALKDRRGEGTALNNLGNIFSNWGQHAKAVSYYEKALAIDRALKNRRGEGSTLNNLGTVFSDWGDYDKAIKYYSKSLAIDRALNNLQGEGNSLHNLGNVFQNRGRYPEAVKYYEQSLAIRRGLKDRGGEGQTLNALGVVFMDWGQYAKAMRYYEKALAISQAVKDRKGEGQSLGNLAILYTKRGQYAKAVDYYQKSVEIFRELKNPQGEAKTFNNMGSVYKDWGRYGKAVDYFERSLAIDRALKNPQGEGHTLNNLGNLYADWGQYGKALDFLEKSLVIKRSLKDRWGEGQSLGNLGRVYARQGDSRKAKKKIQECLAIWENIKFPTEWPKYLLANLYLDEGDFRRAEPLLIKAGNRSSRGRLFLLKSEYGKAKSEYEKLFQSAEKNRNVDDLFTAYTGLGRSYERMRNYGKATEYYRKAVAFTEELRTSLTPNQREKFFDVKIAGFLRTAPYEGLARVLMRMNKPTDAFKGSEFTKARVFSEALARLSEGARFDVPSRVLKDDGRLNDQLAALKKSRQKAYEKGNKLVIDSLGPQVKDLEEKLRDHIKMLRAKYPLFAATKYPEPMELSQTALNDNEWALSYDVTDTGVIIYLTKGKELILGLFKELPRKELDELVRNFREPLEIGHGGSIRKKLTSFDFDSGKRLADILLGEILADLPEGAPIMVVPDDSLGVLPFEMLVLNKGGRVKTDKKIPYASGATFFGDRNPISYCQSITALTLSRTLTKREKARAKCLVLDDPVFEAEDPRVKRMARKKRKTMLASLPDRLMFIKTEIGLTFPRLPLTGELGESLKKLDPERTEEYRGMKACKPVLFKKSLNRYGSMVFATHGYFGKDLPTIQEPVLVLTLLDQPKGQDGFLRMTEVMGLKLNADVVALTACQTGLGRRISGEGIMGMGRAFQYAGARSVLMSLWSVAEKSSVMLVESFFKHRKEGKSKLEALQLARKEIREAEYDHPFFWAPFILLGEAN
jgi:tetratricopeptide (TPR) repeat protein